MLPTLLCVAIITKDLKVIAFMRWVDKPIAMAMNQNKERKKMQLLSIAIQDSRSSGWCGYHWNTGKKEAEQQTMPAKWNKARNCAQYHQIVVFH